jgi:hypothetical protein
MPVLFSQNTGRVSAITESVAAGSISLTNVIGSGPPLTNLVLPLPSQNIGYTQQKTIITRIGLSAAGNFQFLHTVGNDVYVYVFGDRMGQIVLHGLSFAQTCPNEKEKANVHGFELLYQWYLRNRIAARKAPVTATIGLNTSFEGFVTALSGDVQDSLHRTIQFQMTIATLPTI